MLEMASNFDCERRTTFLAAFKPVFVAHMRIIQCVPSIVVLNSFANPPSGFAHTAEIRLPPVGWVNAEDE